MSSPATVGIVAWFAIVGASMELGTAAQSTLRQVAVISRHGVRGPYGLGTEVPSAELLKTYIRNPDIELPLRAVDWGTSEDPSEGVSPKLTKHGYMLVKKMGQYFRKHLYREFIADTPCKQAFAYADNNQRDNLTAEAFIDGAYPKCQKLVPTVVGSRLLFEQGQDPTATCPVCSRTVYEGITGAPDCRYLVQQYRKEITELNEILDCCTPAACLQGSDDNSSCTFFDIPPQWNGAFYDPWKDPLSSADYFTEFLMLQSLNNMSLPAPFTFEKVLQLAKVHEAHLDLVTNDVNSANFGATLLAHVAASFEQRATGKAVNIGPGDGPGLAQALDNRFLFYAGHDINILYLRNLLRLQWYTRGWHPHQPTPGGMLVFELHSSSPPSTSTNDHVRTGRQLNDVHHPTTEDDYFVKLYFVTATPEQMRNGETLTDQNPPDIVPVIIPLCSKDVELSNGKLEVRCPLRTFKALLGRTLKHECVADTLRPFVDSLDAQTANTHSPVSLSAGLWVLAIVFVALFLGVLIRHTLVQRRHRSRPGKPEYGTLPQVSAE